jgi:hypothetical protein
VKCADELVVLAEEEMVIQGMTNQRWKRPWSGSEWGKI